MSDRRINFIIIDGSRRLVDRFSVIFSNQENSELNDNEKAEDTKLLPKFDVSFYVDGYFLSIFHNILTSSVNYRKIMKENLFNMMQSIPTAGDVNVLLQLVHPQREVLDYGWNDRMSSLVTERCELENSMSWLSTLGGAFSALGDNFEYCAKVAGKISVHQLQIALRLGDPPLVARCKLYMALSLIQQKNLKLAKRVVEDQYEVAKNFKDFRLINMCKGIWAKLKYTYQIEKSKKTNLLKQNELNNFNESIY